MACCYMHLNLKMFSSERYIHYISFSLGFGQHTLYAMLDLYRKMLQLATFVCPIIET